ncbi:cell wall metabolism sensor histidine kinase WalK [Streptomyces sp. NBC_00893]|uniref:sensor histidine kinase n=1 Tax=Streptomyces sp. NBC_00893 TaxID=2975862 RepID=UPI0022533917|nr:HAMP domain-containing sensor histidine kinase [Streptomyces sp. NBC_00893]MCX4844522.1 HAMP domain-containing histidine kinase [Streptomyces sp. NBC_00893]
MSLRTRLLCLATSLVATGLVAAGAVVSTALNDYLEGRVDARLHTTAQIAARVTPPSGTDSPQNVRVLSSFEDTTVSYVDDAGVPRNTFDSTTAAPGGGPHLPELDRDAVLDRAGRPFTVPARDEDHSWRVVALTRPGRLIGPADRPVGSGSVVVATSLDEVDRTVQKTRTVSLTAGGVLLGVLALVGWFAVRSGLRPLTRIEETAEAITSGDFSHRIPETAGSQTEVGRLTACLNRMLGQIDTAFRGRAEAESRMRRFFADASHELRTPLVGIKGYTDLYRMGASQTRRETDHIMTRIAEESDRLTHLVGDMLLLARLDEAAQGPAVGIGPVPAFPLERAPMDLRTLAVDALHDVRALDATRPVTLTGPNGGRPATAPTLADEERLRQVVTNLVGNAVAHSPSGTPVRIGVGVRDGLAVLEVADQGPGLSPEERQRVFERFYRADASRSRATGAGAGLGLSIVHSLVTAHGGSIELDTAPGEGCTFRVRLALLEPMD